MPQRNAVRYLVYANGLISNHLEVLHMEESAGADRLDNATLEYKAATLQDLTVSALLNQEIEIRRADNSQVVHWGMVTKLPTLISDDGETLELVSRTELFHLGGMVDGYLVWDPIAATTAAIDGDLVFNPMIDGKIYGNLNDTKNTAGGCLVFLDPESVRTSAARALQGANVAYWTLSQTVFYLLWSLNTPQTYVSNPDDTTLDTVFDDPTALVQEVRIPRGTYLPQALDILLEPLGYRWRVKRTAIGSRVYEFFKKNTGGELVSVYHQSLGSTLSNPRNNAQTNVETSGITFDNSQLANEIWVRGGYEEYEITTELCRGWNKTADAGLTAATTENYAKDAPNFDSVRDVGRKWVLNEAGDYIGTRDEITGIFNDTLRTQLGSLGLLNHFIPRRRKFMPTLSQKPAVESSAHDLVPIGKLRGVEVEYSNTDPADWKPVTGFECALLEQEAGIYFDGHHLPEEFLYGGLSNLRIRVTATLQGDYRITGHVARQLDSPQAVAVPVVLDLPDRFRFKLRHSSLSKYGGGSVPSSAVDDRTALQSFAEKIRDTFDHMDISGPIQLEGLDHTYEVSDRVQSIEFKNLVFLTRLASGAYPQIVAIERDIHQQIMTLHLERQRDVLQLPAASTGNTPRFRSRTTARDFV